MYLPQSVMVGLLACLALLVSSAHADGQAPAAPAPGRLSSERAGGADKITRLIRQLGSEKFADREAASKALSALGEAAVPTLRKSTEDSDPEVRRRVAALLQARKLRCAPMRAAAWALLTSRRCAIDSDTRTPEGCIRLIDGRSSPKLRDEDLAALQWLDEVKALGLRGTGITDAGLTHVKHPYRLEVLELGQTKITDAGLEHLQGLSTLRVLAIYSTRVTDAGLPKLRKLDKLGHLDLAYDPITDAGLDHVQELKELSWLCLTGTRITDAGLAKLKTLKKLEYLNLSKTQITDAGLAHLRELQSLRTLNTVGTKVTDEALAELRKIIPGLGTIGR